MKKYLYIIFTFIFTFNCLGNDFVLYTESGFKNQLNSGNKLILQFHAAWCPVCKKQKNSLQQALKSESYNGIVVIIADYDKEKELKQLYKIPQQSTLLLFQNKKEISREIAITDFNEIKKLAKRFK